jgi:dTDP-4-amino-4,6-dideoxygalactose transaminase
MIPGHNPHTLHEVMQALSSLRKKGIKKDFEDQMKSYFNTDRYMTVAYGRRALYIGLKALGIGKGDEVIIPAFTTDIVPLVLQACGSTPVPADVHTDEYTVDVESVKEVISSRTKAVLTVHTFGYPSDILPLKEVCSDYGLYFIENAASAFGARYNKQPVGTFGDVSIVSFGFGKGMSMGAGGGIITVDDAVFEKVTTIAGLQQRKSSVPLLMKVLGITLLSHPWLYTVGYHLKEEMVSRQYKDYKKEIDDEGDISVLSYALGMQQIMRKVYERRREIALQYMDILKDTVFVPVEKKGRHSVYTRFFVRVESEEVRTTVCDTMKRRGIEPVVPCYGFPISPTLYPSRFEIPGANLLSKTLVAVPVHTALCEETLVVIFRL